MAIELQALRAIPEFGMLADAELVHVQKVTRERPIQRGELLLMEGAPGDRLYYLQSGRVKVYKTSPDGKEQVLRIFQAGEIFNEVLVFDGGQNPASAMTLEDGIAYTMSRTDIRRLLTEHPTIALSVIQVLASRLRDLMGLVEGLPFNPLLSLLAWELREIEAV